jgi:hypothetical protein
MEDATTPKDAPPIVNKAPGDKLDIVAVVTNNEETSQAVKVELTNIPSELGIPEKVIIRTDFSPHTTIHEVQPGLFPIVLIDARVESFGLSVELTNLKPGGKMQIVWRFTISDSAQPQSTIVKAAAGVGGTVCAIDADGFHICDEVDAIIVTNRYLLYEKYDDNEVSSLLTYLYQISEWRNTISEKNCIVYYADHYDTDVKNWNQNIDYSSEDKANKVANKIDDLIEKWVGETDPEYLMIIGGDEVIPFYRLNDANYYDTADNDPFNNDDPVLHTFDENYFLSDNPYADTSGNDYDTGKVELSIGRIVGSSAQDMKGFIENSRPATLVIAVVVHDGQVDDAIEALKKKATTIRESENWDDDQLENELTKGFQIFFFDRDHGNYNGLLPPGGGKLWDDGVDNVNTNGAISNNKSHCVFSVCRVGVVTDEDGVNWKPEWDDCMLYALVSQGGSGVVAAGGKTINGVDVTLINLYFSKLIKDGKESLPFGTALRDAKIGYDKGSKWDDSEKKTVTEFIYYGVPWGTINLQGKKQGDLTEKSSDVSIEISNPIQISGDKYSQTIEVNVTNYMVSKVDSYDLIEINGTELALDEHLPIVPLINVKLFLPLDSEVTGVSLVNNTTAMIGNYHIPSFISAEDPGKSGYGQSTGVGLYPSPIYQVEIVQLEYHKVILLKVAAIQYNPQTNETILNNYVKLELAYQTPVTATIINFSPEKTKYTSGEPIIASAVIGNIGSDDLAGLHVNLSLKDPYGEIKASSTSTPFDAASGESTTMVVELDQSLLHGSYTCEMNLTDSTENVLGRSSEHIYISTGNITTFSHPGEVTSGEDITFNITFKNTNTTSVEGKGIVYIYDSNGIEIAGLPSLPVTVAFNSEEQMSINWNTLGKEIGEYNAIAYVFTDEESFSSEYSTFEIKEAPAPSKEGQPKQLPTYSKQICSLASYNIQKAESLNC